MFERKFANDKMLNTRPKAFSQSSVLKDILQKDYGALTFLKLFVSSATFEKAISIKEGYFCFRNTIYMAH